MKRFSEFRIPSIVNANEIQLQHEDDYEGQIVNYPIRSSECIYEALVSTYPSKNFVKSLQKIVDCKAIFSKLPKFCSNNLHSHEDATIELILNKEAYEKNVKVIYDKCEFYGYYLNHVYELHNEIHSFIYPKFQSSFLEWQLDEKYLIHITSIKNLEKILKNGLKPYSKFSKLENLEKYSNSKFSKLENLEKYSHNEKTRSIYNELIDSWTKFNHPDRIHFFCGKAFKEKFNYSFFHNLMEENSNDCACLIVDISELTNKTSFCIDPNCSSKKEFITVYTQDNIPPDSIAKYFEISKDDLFEFSKLKRNVLEYIEKRSFS